MKTTKQGVRDLNHLPEGPSRGRKIQTPESLRARELACSHPERLRERHYFGDTFYESYIACGRCGKTWDYRGL